jgi:hypothetical protein
MFDPYLEWLKIPAERRPPTHYELLGLPAFEQDAARIHQAAMDRMALVRRYQLGERAEVVIGLLGELSRAFDCLSDADRKRDYDEQLRSEVQKRVSVVQLAESAGLKTRRQRSWFATAAWTCGACAVAAMALVLWQASQSASPSVASGNADSSQTGQVQPVRPAQSAAVSTTIAKPDGPLVDLQEPNDAGDETLREAPPVSVPSALPLVPPLASRPRIRYFGYGFIGPPRRVPDFAPYTNMVLVRDWLDRGPAAIAAARDAGLPVVLNVSLKEPERLAKSLPPILDRFGDQILAVCWFAPYRSGYTPQNVAGFGRRLKQNHPKLQYWIAVGDVPRGDYAESPVPPEVDAIVVIETFDVSPEAVRAKADDVLPGWRQRAGERPLLLCWTSATRGAKGLVPRVLPGTFRACAEMVHKHQLDGLLFDRYGDPKDQELEPIDSRPELVQEIRQLAAELGFQRKTGN